MFELLRYIDRQQKLWPECVNAQAHLNLYLLPNKLSLPKLRLLLVADNVCIQFRPTSVFFVWSRYYYSLKIIFWGLKICFDEKKSTEGNKSMQNCPAW